MEEIQIKPKKIILTYGTLLGIILIVFSLMLFSMDMQYERGFAVQGVQFLFIIAAAVIGVVQFKKVNEGFLKLSEALKIGAGVALIGGIIGTLYFLVFSNFIEPDFMVNSYEIGKQQALEANPKLTSEQIDQGIEIQKKFFSVFLIVGILFQVIIGLVAGLIGGLILKKAKPDY
ncbi:MAG: DUF4199 domain-containing protein [Flavobacteriaceae bacterium]|nr:MAG: DUF4199 domain-containing protein [Flavobacteriaceae bacterium]